ncbi:MAG: UrcA family protein [Tsuneonella suprasediminis]|nr:UrcA family protein [Tsuneonella suprasediminis]UBS33705.1 UrcA family protein [Altererythrobacter sp. N1]
MSSPLLAIALASAISATSPAPTMQVKFDDLNLSTPAGQEMLQKRIKSAARDVCGMDDKTTGTRIRSSESARCYNQAVGSATAAVAAAVRKARADS